MNNDCLYFNPVNPMAIKKLYVLHTNI